MADGAAASPAQATVTLTAHYEHLRAGVLAGQAEGWRFGLGVLANRGMAAWITAWQSIPPSPTTPTPPQHAATAHRTDNGELVRVLAAMALAHV